MTTVRYNTDGIALMMVLWVMAILIGLSLTLAYISRSESRVSSSSRQYVAAGFLAEGGINRAIIELYYRRTKPQDDETRWKIDGSFRSVEVVDGSALVRVMPETGKVDLNLSNDIILKGLVNALGIDADTQDIIVDSIRDWMDSDDLHRLHGAESDYYMSLKRPYKAKNAPFDTVDELLMIRGVTSEIFYGTSDKKGLRDFVTVYNRIDNSKININAAPKEVLMALPNVTEEVASAIVEQRKAALFKNTAELQALLPETYEAIKNYINVPNENTEIFFSIDAIGKSHDNASSVGIKAIVEISANDFKFVSYKMPETFKFQEQEDKSMENVTTNKE
ncbi:general secretion pathway protein GspK [Candidatus Magnetobacterium casense]|uniref:General secretion pathway protein GspK n=1 Tax=Candidatus Magnetobacterium casense TaxID=1455061 RepID=A0ABS6RXU3_9BACT|nr:general secretion pathway protein GspK [Candidatus Magnetobacterium casensis]MBV6341457.1 general secretion pathway protein GspK [Candidatus Magnetobacterium casensis]